MSVSAFTFYRATAAIMAADLASTPRTPLITQLCGDAHLANFGGFASPERDLLFDVNDFDETLPGPWEWDVKRLAASLVIAARHAGLGEKAARAITATALDHYQQAIRAQAKMGNLETWYDRVAMTDVRAQIGSGKALRGFDRNARKARRRTSLRSFEKLAEVVGGEAQIRRDPPLLVPLRELTGILVGEDWEAVVLDSYNAYKATLSDEMQTLLDRYRLVDVALKVVGVGSVGTRCFVSLFIGRDRADPLFLQVKEAGQSALEPELGAGRYTHPGRRVVEGQRLMQSFSDIFLGWSSNSATGRDHYWRQLKDMKWSADVDNFEAGQLDFYSGLCGSTLARAHARAGDPVPIAAYLGKNNSFAKATVRFAELYADQAAEDFEAFSEALASGRLSSAAPEDSPISA